MPSIEIHSFIRIFCMINFRKRIFFYDYSTYLSPPPILYLWLFFLLITILIIKTLEKNIQEIERERMIRTSDLRQQGQWHDVVDRDHFSFQKKKKIRRLIMMMMMIIWWLNYCYSVCLCVHITCISMWWLGPTLINKKKAKVDLLTYGECE